MPTDTRQLMILRLLLVVAILLSFYLNIHAIPLFDLDEGAFSEATREMFLRHDFISTYLNGVHRFDKPILIYWLQALSTRAFGFTELGFRLPSALASTGWVLVTYAFVRRIKDERAALYAALITATALQISIIGKAAIADALLNLWITVSMFAVYLYYRDGERHHLYLAFAAMGLGFLTKGPVAVLIPLAVSFLFYASRRRLADWLRGAFDLRAIAIFLIIAAPWYVLEYLRQGQAFVDGFFLTHNINRFRGPMETHGGSLLYYVPVVLIGLLPYTSLLFSTFGGFKSLWKDDLGRFSLLWFLFVFVFFSLSGTKLPHYVIYGYSGMIVLMAIHRNRLRSAFWALLPILLFFTALTALPWVVPALAPTEKDPFVRAALTGVHFPLRYLVAAVLGTLVVAYLMFRHTQTPTFKLVVAGLLTVTMLWGFAMPVVADTKQAPIKEAALIAKAHHYHVVMWKLDVPSFIVYSGQLVEKRAPRPGEVVITKQQYLAQLPGYTPILIRNGIAMVRVKN